MERDILKIDEELCNGCGVCVPNCHEGALQVIDGKVRLISELMCDGLGACIGHCPEGAITIEKREAEPYSEVKVMEQMVQKGKNTIIAHLKHLKDHGEIRVAPVVVEHHGHGHEGGGCPGSRAMVINKPAGNSTESESGQSELRQWPVQMHLINPNAPYFRSADLLVAADCVAYSVGGFHSQYLKGKSLAIACPKLDQGMEIYVEKLKALIDVAKINTITVMIMEVPCCGGLLQMVKSAAGSATRKVPVKLMIAGITGEILREEWV
jgi:NAD-dependent dihydropyrimidine dehydrogenase PreA subunit